MNTALALLVAWLGALGVGVSLGRLASDGLRGRAVVNLLIEARGALLPFVIAAMWLTLPQLPRWLVIGATAALVQGIAVARWVLRHDSDAAGLAGDIALGHSGGGISTRHAAARGAVSSTVAFVVVVVCALEALATRWSPTSAPTGGSLGAWMVTADSTVWLAWVLAALILVGLEAGTRALISGRAAGAVSHLLRSAARRV
ncbi:MAG TPA: hypothetical protein VLC09_01705 [Polyangiaceae bacterium]|nr:hypothetical protein [Polyangiaceae bacterium]